MEFVYVVPREALFPSSYPHGLVPFDESHLSGGLAGGTGADGRSNEGHRVEGHRVEGQLVEGRRMEGATPTDAAAFEELVLRHGYFVERDYAEQNPSLKQIIPYAIVRGPEGILLTKRLSAGGESRLHDKLSIGIGGHINPIDAEGRSWSDRSRSDRRPPRGRNFSDEPSADRRPAERHPIAAAAARELSEELDVDGEYELSTVGILNDDSNPVGAVHLGVVQIATVDGTVAIREKQQLEGRFVDPAELGTLLAAGADFESWSALLVERLDDLLPRPAASLSST